MRSRMLLALALLVGTTLAGCVDGSSSDGDAQGVGGPIGSSSEEEVVQVTSLTPVLEPEPATDRRFGEDRPLVFEDLDGLLPTDSLTDFNTTRDYLVSMVPHEEFFLFEAGRTLDDRILFAVLLSDDGEFHEDRPTILLTCSQHGNEPSGSEACLIMIEYFVHGVDDLAQDIRTKLNVVMLPLANPDGKDLNQRVNYEGVDINRDHMDMVTLEGRAIHALSNQFDPEVAIDLHEFGGSGSQHALYPTVPVSTYVYFEVAAPQTVYNNDEVMLQVNYELERLVLQTMWDEYGYGGGSHYPSTNSVSSIQRNHYGMHNSLSLLFETGGGTGTTNIDLRTREHLLGTFVVLEWMLADPQAVLDLEAGADARSSTSVPGIQGWVIPDQEEDSDKLAEFLTIHNLEFEVLDVNRNLQVSHYETGPDSVPTTKAFDAGSILVDRFQPDGRVAYEIFEATHDQYYDHGPRDWGLDVWRIIE